MTDELPGGLDAKKLAKRIVREYGRYSVSEYGITALPDWLWTVSRKYPKLSEEERTVVDNAMAKELYE